MAPPHAELFDRELDYITVLLFVKLLRRDGGAQIGLSISGQHAKGSRNLGTAHCFAEIYARAPDSSIGNVGESVGKETRKRRGRGAYFDTCVLTGPYFWHCHLRTGAQELQLSQFRLI